VVLLETISKSLIFGGKKQNDSRMATCCEMDICSHGRSRRSFGVNSKKYVEKNAC